MRGVVEPPGGVEPRREAKPDDAGGDASRRDAGDLHERRESRARRAAQAAEPHRDQGAVLVDQRSEVGDGPQRDHVGERAQGQRQLDARRARARCSRAWASLNATPTPARCGHGAPGELRGDHDALRQRALDLVVVGDDDVHAELVRPGDFVAGADAAVDGDEQLDALAGELLDRRRGDAVAFGEAVRQAPAHVGAELLEHAHEQEGGGDAVGVVVAVHGDGLAALQGPVDAAARLCHPGQQVGVVDEVVWLEEGLGLGRVDEAAAHEDLGEGLADAKLVGQPARGGVTDRRDAPGTVVDQGCITSVSVPRGGDGCGRPALAGRASGRGRGVAGRAFVGRRRLERTP